jgi:DNA-binding transcriptional regulator GbsR (MarR family)
MPLKLVLKLYLKLVDKSRRKGSDPLLIFQNLVERIVTGKLYETTQDRIDHMDSLLEERQAAVPGDHKNTALHKEINEIKAMLKDLQNTGHAAAPYAHEMREFSPKDAARLLDVDKTATSQKKRKNYRDLRKESGPKKINF